MGADSESSDRRGGGRGGGCGSGCGGGMERSQRAERSERLLDAPLDSASVNFCGGDAHACTHNQAVARG